MSINLPHWLYDIRGDDELKDIYPTMRSLNEGEVNAVLAWMPMLWELCDRLYEATNNEQWQTLATTTRNSTLLAAQFSNRTYIYRKNPGIPLEYPGTSITGSRSRQTTGVFTNYVRVQGTGNLIVQNLDTQVAIENATTYLAEVGSSVANQVLEFFVSTSIDDSSNNSLYRHYFRLGDADDPVTKEITTFHRYDDLAWHYGVGLVSGTPIYESQSISGVEHVVLRLDADAELNINESSINPFKLQVRVIDGPATVRLQDGNNQWWDYGIPVGNWSILEPSWADFEWSSINTVTQGSNTPTGTIQAIRILTNDRIYIWWVGANPPTPLPRPTLIYRGGIADRNTGSSRSFYVGDVYSPNTSSDLLPYTPGVVPFARNIVDNVPGSLTGLPYSGYQNVYGWDQPEYVTNIVKFLKDAQVAYSKSTDDTGPFAPVFTWNDIGNVNQGGDINKFGFEGFDDLATSAEYQAQVGLWLARAWFKDKNNSELRDLAMSWLRWLDQVYAPREAELPPNLFPEGDVAIPGHNPGVQALIGEAALWCNLAGGDPATTFRWIYRTIDYLDSQYIADEEDLMEGSWSKSQPSFGSLNQYYSWWHGACLNTYSLFVLNKDNITYPPCSEPLEIPTSEPLPDICCGATLVSLDDYGNPILP